MSFIHLSLHSEFSLLDSTVRIKPLINRTAELGMPAVAITDQVNLFCLVKFFRAAEAAGIKPIAGADLWIVNDDDIETPDRMVVLCQNMTGYRTLSRLISRAYMERDGLTLPIVKREWIAADNDGLIALSGNLDGEIGRLVRESKLKRAQAAAEFWQGIFDNRFYIELLRCGHEHEDRYNQVAVSIASALKLPVIASNNVRFLERSDFASHEARVCIHQGRVLDDNTRPRDYTAEQFLKSADDMAVLFRDIPQALENTVELAKRCNLKLETGEYFLPDFPVPEGQTIDEYLEEVSAQGLTSRLEAHGLAEGYSDGDYRERLTHEIRVIVEMGFPGYFLIVADFITWARDNGIPVGPGRGSGAGSLVAWALGITDLDPLRYELLFERFLNPERISMPDFDIDFCMDRRDEVIDYVARKYGRSQVSQIITFGTMAARAVVRDTGRILGHPYGFADSIAKLIPPTVGVTINKALEESPELRERMHGEEDVADLIKLALSLEGLSRNAGKHAGGVVIAPGSLDHFTPMYSEPNGEGAVTQFDKDDVETIGLVKFDFLGLRTLTIIDWAVKAINQKLDADDRIAIEAIPLDDPATIELLKACNTTAVFQLESRGMKDLMRRLVPGQFEEIIALVALFRPGPLDSGMVDTYVDCKHGRQQVTYPHPDLEPILQPTYGVILYQEQVMQIAQVLAGYTLGAADMLRRAMGKKKPEEMAKQRAIFVSGATERGVEGALADSIFDLMEKFAGYGFNKSHSAAYALIAYQTAFLKAHYQAEFMAAVLSADMDNTDKIAHMIDDVRAQEIQLDQPDINHSVYQFTATSSDTIRYGLGAIKGAGQAAIESFLEERDSNGPYVSLHDFCNRVDTQKVNKRVLESLILSGAMDCLEVTRSTLMATLPEALKAAEQEARDREAGQSDMFGTVAASSSREDYHSMPEWSDDERLKSEKSALGLYLTGHPIDQHQALLRSIVSSPLGELDTIYRPQAVKPGGRPQQQPCIVAGLVTGMRRRSENVMILQIDDGTSRIEVTLFSDALREYHEMLESGMILVVDGGLLPDDFNGGYQVRAQRLFTMDQAVAEFAQAIQIRFNGESPRIDQLKAILKQHQPGQQVVFIDLQNDAARGRMKLDDQWRVAASPELRRTLEAMHGVESAQIVFSKTAARAGE